MITQQKQILSMVAVVLAAAASVNAGTPVVKQVVTGDIGLGPYIALQGGANVHTAVSHEYGKNTFGNVDTLSDRYQSKSSQSAKSSIAGFAGVKLGYVFKTDALVRPAIELDSYWVQSKLTVRNYSKEVYNPYYNSNVNDVYTTETTTAGRANTFANMINGLAKFDLGSFQPYAGLGIGLATTGWSGNTKGVDTRNGDVTARYNASAFNESSSTYFAFQAIAGADYYVRNNLSVFTEYKFLNVCGDAGNSLRNNIVGAGVRFHF